MTPAIMAAAGEPGGAAKPKRETTLGDRVCDVVEELYSSGVLYSDGVREFKKRFLLRVLRAHDGNQFKAAIELNMHRNTLSRTIRELNLRDELEAIRRP